jgi:predicted dienelactone hydrolase
MLRRLLFGLPLALFVALAACSSDGDSDPAPTATPVPVALYAERGQYHVGVMTIEVVDTSRETPANGEVPASPERRLPLEIWYPIASAEGAVEETRDAAVHTADGPYPLIVFAHGFSASRAQSAQFTRHLASRGYVVASPDFPSSNGGAPGGPRLRGVIEQPGDVSFIIDEFERRDGDADWALAGAIDFERIGMTGHSLGGLTTVLATYGAARDARIDASLPISPPGCFVGAIAGEVTTPIMVVGGSEEIIVDPSWIRQSYETANAPRYYVEIGGADHIKFADVDVNDRDIGEGIVGRIAGDTLISDAIEIAGAAQGNVADCTVRDGARGKEYITGDRQREVLRLFGGLFFDAYLRGDTNALALIRGGDLGTVAGDTLVEHE